VNCLAQGEVTGMGGRERSSASGGREEREQALKSTLGRKFIAM